MNVKFIRNVNEESAYNFGVLIISILSLISIYVCEKCTWSLHLGFREIIKNISISVFAAGIFCINGIIAKLIMKKKFACLVQGCYRSVADDVNYIYQAILADEKWYKSKDILQDSDKPDWFDKEGIKIINIDNETYYCDSRISLLSLAINDFELSIKNLEDVLEWCDYKEIEIVNEFYNSVLYKRVRLLKNVPDVKPTNFAGSLLENKLKEIDMRIKEQDNQKCMYELAKFVSKYRSAKE